MHVCACEFQPSDGARLCARSSGLRPPQAPSVGRRKFPKRKFPVVAQARMHACSLASWCLKFVSRGTFVAIAGWWIGSCGAGDSPFGGGFSPQPPTAFAAADSSVSGVPQPSPPPVPVRRTPASTRLCVLGVGLLGCPLRMGRRGVFSQPPEDVEVPVPGDRKTRMVIDLLAKYVAEVRRRRRRCCCPLRFERPPFFLQKFKRWLGLRSEAVAHGSRRSLLGEGRLVFSASKASLARGVCCLQEGHPFEQQVMEKFPEETGRALGGPDRLGLSRASLEASQMPPPGRQRRGQSRVLSASVLRFQGPCCACCACRYCARRAPSLFVRKKLPGQHLLQASGPPRSLGCSR